MTDSKSRFEARFPNLDLSGCMGENLIFSTGESSSVWLYHKNSTQIAWNAWQACEAQSAARIAKLEVLQEDVAEYLHWRKVNPQIKGGENYLKRFREALTNHQGE